jgi:hypothetical protein
MSSLCFRSLTISIDGIELLAIWSTIEQGLGITAGSLATLRPLLRSWLRHYRHKKSGKSRSRRRWLFGYGSSTGQTSGSEGFTPHESSMSKTMVVTSFSKNGSIPSTFASPLTTVEAPDFLDITNTGSNETLDLPNQAYVQYNTTPKLQKDVRWCDYTPPRDEPFLFSIFDETRAPLTEEPVMFTPQARTMSMGRIHGQPRTVATVGRSRSHQSSKAPIAHPGAVTSSSDRLEERRNSSRATWWPLPRSSVAEADDSEAVETRRQKPR